MSEKGCCCGPVSYTHLIIFEELSGNNAVAAGVLALVSLRDGESAVFDGVILTVFLLVHRLEGKTNVALAAYRDIKEF